MRIPNHKTTSSSTEQYGFNPVAPPLIERRLSFFGRFFWIFCKDFGQKVSATDGEENGDEREPRMKTSRV